MPLSVAFALYLPTRPRSGFRTCGDLQGVSAAPVCAAAGKLGEDLWRAARGEDEAPRAEGRRTRARDPRLKGGDGTREVKTSLNGIYW